MKKLFVFILAASGAIAAEPKKAPPPPPAPAVEPAPRKPTPGFWERAWTSTKKSASGAVNATKRAGGKVAGVVTDPLGRRKKPAEATFAGLAMSIGMEPAQVKLPETRSVRLAVTIANKGKHAAQLDFPTTQRIEVLVKNDAGKVLAKWSDDQKVGREQGFIVVNPGERLEYTATVSTREMSAGQSYTIEASCAGHERIRATRVVAPVK